MGFRRVGGWAVGLAAALGAAGQAAAAVQVEPIARIGLEGGYDSNPLYDGRGGDGLGRVSPDLGVQVRDRTYDLRLTVGGDLLRYLERQNRSLVWNQRGSLVLAARPTARTTLDSGVSVTYAIDPVGLARLGIFGRSDSVLIVNGTLRSAVALDRHWRLAGTFAEHLARFEAGDGAASHQPGVEVTRFLNRRLELGAGYRFDYFQGIGAGARDATAHEALAVLRWRWSRELTLEATAGPTLFFGPDGGGTLLPQASVGLMARLRHGDARASARHGVGLGNLARPGLFDAIEAGYTNRLSRHVRVHADGGVWRSGAIPWGADATLGYGVEGEVAWLFDNGLEVGLGWSRFARMDTSDTTHDRNTVGIRAGWELRRR